MKKTKQTSAICGDSVVGYEASTKLLGYCFSLHRPLKKMFFWFLMIFWPICSLCAVSK